MRTEHTPWRLDAKTWGWLALACCALVELSLLTRHSLWNNEFITLRAIWLGWGEMVHERVTHNHMPLYFLALKGWTAIFGQGEASLRLPSVLLSLAGMALVWRLGAWLLGEGWGTVALALTAANSALMGMAHDARMYSWLWAASLASTLCLLRWLEEGRRRWLAALVAAGLIGLATHMLYLFVPLAALPWVVLTRRTWRGRWKAAMAALAVPLVALTPLMLWWSRVQYKVGREDAWFKPQFGAAIRRTALLFAGDVSDVPVVKDLAIAATAAVLLLTVWIWWQQRRATENGTLPPRARRCLGLLLLMVWIPLLGLALASMKTPDNMASNVRYYVTAAAATPLLLVCALAWLRSQGWRRTCGALEGLFGVMTLVSLAVYALQPGEGVREAALYVKHRMQPGDKIVTSRTRTRTWGFVYYGVTDRLPAQLPAGTSGKDELRRWVRDQTAQARRVWVVYYAPPKEEKLRQAFAWSEDKTTPFALCPPTFHHGETWVELYEVKTKP